MNFLEALKSGKPFRRKSYHDDDGPYANALEWLASFSLRENSNERMVIDDILAEDWEIQEPTVTVAKTQLFDLAIDARRETIASGKNSFMDAIELLAKKIGL